MPTSLSDSSDLQLRGLSKEQLESLVSYANELSRIQPYVLLHAGGESEERKLEDFYEKLDEIELFRQRSEREFGGGLGERASATSGYKLQAMLNLLADFSRQGWKIEACAVKDGVDFKFSEERAGEVVVPSKEETRWRLLSQRREQLRDLRTQKFIRKMEKLRCKQNTGEMVCIYNLMRDGEELAEQLGAVNLEEGAAGLGGVVSPYLQPILESDGQCCEFTGILLKDIWRYFRHTWASPSEGTPGRTMQILIRDAAAEFHPVIGIAALSSAPLKLRARDQLIGWDLSSFVAQLQMMWKTSLTEKGAGTGETRKLSSRIARWIEEGFQRGLAELYTDDLIEEKIITQADLAMPGAEFDKSGKKYKELKQQAKDLRDRHLALGDKAKLHGPPKDGDWEKRAKTLLFKGKRILALLDLLLLRRASRPFLSEDRKAVRYGGGKVPLLDEPEGHGVMGLALGEASSRAHTQVADISVCGAVPPYNHLLGSKLVSMLVASPEILAAYREHYAGHVSQIDSSKAGRAIVRSSDLAFISTSSLYTRRPCQYDRLSLKLPEGGSIRYTFLRRLRKSQVSRLAETYRKDLELVVGEVGDYLKAEKFCSRKPEAAIVARRLRSECLEHGVIRWDSEILQGLGVEELTKKRRQELSRELTRLLLRPSMALLKRIPGIEGKGNTLKLNRAREIAQGLIELKGADTPVEALYQALLDFCPDVIGHTHGFGSVQFSQATTGALRVFLDSLSNDANKAERGASEADPEVSRQHRRAHNVFGEGTSPKMRMVRDGISKLGAPKPDKLMKHGQKRLCYGIILVENALEYLVGLSLDLSVRTLGKGKGIKPRYSWGGLLPEESTKLVIGWWLEKKLLPRLARADGLEATLARLREESLDLPIRHGARVLLPPIELEVALSFD